MDGIQEFLSSPLGQIVILVVVALFFGKNPDLVNRILEILKIQKPKVENNVSPAISDLDDDGQIDKADAYVAAENLITYFSGQGKECEEGLAAAKKAGQCLFH